MQHSRHGPLPSPPQPGSVTTNGGMSRSNVPPQPPTHSLPGHPPQQPYQLPTHPATTAVGPPHPQPQPHPSQLYFSNFYQLNARLHRSVQNVFSAASAMLLSDDPSAARLFDELEQMTTSSDGSLLYLVDMDALLQMESANVYPPSLPLSMSSQREEYWRTAYDTMRLQWAVMDKLRSRHNILKQAAADFWPTQPEPSPPPAPPTNEPADTDPPVTTQTVKQDEQMNDDSTVATSVEAANNTHTSALTGNHHPPPGSDHIDLTSTTDNSPSPGPTPSQPLTDTAQSDGGDVTVDTPMSSLQPGDSSPSPPSILLTPQPPQSTTPVMPQPADSPSHMERPEPVESARSVMDLTDDTS